jgi:hypothetical protein
MTTQDPEAFDAFEEAESERRWDELFARSQDLLARMAAEAHEEYRAGLTAVGEIGRVRVPVVARWRSDHRLPSEPPPAAFAPLTRQCRNAYPANRCKHPNTSAVKSACTRAVVSITS